MLQSTKNQTTQRRLNVSPLLMTSPEVEEAKAALAALEASGQQTTPLNYSFGHLRLDNILLLSVTFTSPESNLLGRNVEGTLHLVYEEGSTTLT